MRFALFLIIAMDFDSSEKQLFDLKMWFLRSNRVVFSILMLILMLFRVFKINKLYYCRVKEYFQYSSLQSFGSQIFIHLLMYSKTPNNCDNFTKLKVHQCMINISIDCFPFFLIVELITIFLFLSIHLYGLKDPLHKM